MAASVKSRRACGPSFVFLAKARSWDALKSPRNDTGIAMTNLHRSPPMNQSKTDLGIVNESQLLRFGIRLDGRCIIVDADGRMFHPEQFDQLLRFDPKRTGSPRPA